jgi:hypothetical protein
MLTTSALTVIRQNDQLLKALSPCHFLHESLANVEANARTNQASAAVVARTCSDPPNYCMSRPSGISVVLLCGIPDRMTEGINRLMPVDIQNFRIRAVELVEYTFGQSIESLDQQTSPLSPLSSDRRSAKTVRVEKDGLFVNVQPEKAFNGRKCSGRIISQRDSELSVCFWRVSRVRCSGSLNSFRA